jgi:hypothetical protein
MSWQALTVVHVVTDLNMHHQWTTDQAEQFGQSNVDVIGLFKYLRINETFARWAWTLGRLDQYIYVRRVRCG